ncbi:MAG: glutamine synthetase beta-grasp domain-containing protein [Planctomycetota bacterium]
MKIAEYIWLDGAQPTQQVRSKARVLDLPARPALEDLPVWGFDGSSTNQADGGDSDLMLQPVCVVTDPLRGGDHVLVLCEVLLADGRPHQTNQRARLRDVLERGASAEEPWFGFEQEYTLFSGGRPLGWPDSGYPAPQGPFYCGVGSEEAHGRDLVEAHTRACIDAGLMIYGLNAEVMPGQWEFQIGYRGVEGESADPLTVSDHLWISRWLLRRVGESFGVSAVLDPKPVRGDWNGAGAHTNFSTRGMRDERLGFGFIRDAISRLQAHHAEHIAEYGYGLEDRLTGQHETCSIHEFRAGVADRGASIRTPRQVAQLGYGYLEDRRPGANCDPYRVCARILETIVLSEMAVPAAV